MQTRRQKKIRNKKPVLMALLFFAVYATLAVYNAASAYTMDEMKKDLTKLEKENTQLDISQAQSSSLDNILEVSADMFYTEVGRVSYIEKPSISPFAVK